MSSQTFSKPSHRSTRNNRVSICYELPHRIYTTCRYPVRSPSGSTIIIYGHEYGLTIIWKGGRRPKVHQPTDRQHRNRPRRQRDPDVIAIDSDDEVSANKMLPLDLETAEFEEEDNGTDSSSSYDSVVAETTIELGTSVHHISAAPLPEDAASRVWQSIPHNLQRRLVVAVACGDRSVRLLSLHLDPLGPAIMMVGSDDKKKYGLDETMVIGPVKSRRSLPRSVALTFTGNLSLQASPYADPMDIEDKENEPNAGSWERSKDDNSFALLVATCYSEPSGLLVKSTLPLLKVGGQLEVSKSQQVYLPSPPVTLEFNPSRYPSKRHTQLLVADSNVAVRICDVNPQSGSRRRGSETSLSLDNHDIQWLISLFPPSNDPSAVSTTPRSIPDAKWCMNGKCIVVLLANGHWGLWDLEDSGPSSVDPSFGDNVSRGAISSFSLHGFLRDREDGRSGRKSQSPASDQEDDSRESARLAPMTPRTRKVKRESLFTGASGDRPIARDDTARGGISVAPSSHFATRKSTDDSILFWYGSNIFHIPSLMSYWQRAVNPRPGKSSKPRGSSSFGRREISPPPECRIPHLTDISTSGEFVTNLVQFPHRHIAGSAAEGPSTPAYSKRDLQHDVLIAAEHRFLFLCPERRPEEHKPAEQLNALFEDPFVENAPQSRDDRKTRDKVARNMLKKGDLGLDGINGILEGMEQGSSSKEGRSIGGITGKEGLERARRVGFATED